MVEDDTDLANMLCEYLKKFNIHVQNYEDPYIALSALSFEKYDLIILDLTLPGMDGVDLCANIRKLYQIPIIISSARSDIADKVATLQLGADDYLPKPYDPRELEVRIKAILRRYSHKEEVEEKKFVLEEDKKQISLEKTPLKLTAGEYEILSLLMQKEGFIISRQSIFEYCDILKTDDYDSGSLAVIINRIRHKIEQNPKKPEHLLTIRGMGYKFIQ